MVESLNPSTQELSRADRKRWIGQVVTAVVLGEALWGFIVSIANGLVLPAIAKLVGGAAQSLFSAGKRSFDVPALLESFVQLCLGGIAGALLYSWTKKVPVVKSMPGTPISTVHLTSAAEPDGNAFIAPPVHAPIQPGPSVKTQPKARKVIQYNIVGDPVQDD